MNTMMNGRVRKSLAEQIDRLDRTLDGLANGLNEAVATAVQIAVREALTEILKRPEVLARLQAANRAPVHEDAPQAPRRSWRARCAQIAGAMVLQLRVLQQAVCRGLQAVAEACDAICWRLVDAAHAAGSGLIEKVTPSVHRVRTLVQNARCHLHLLRWLAGPVLVAGAFGGLAGVGAYYAGPWLAAVVSAVGGFMTTAAVRMILWLRRHSQGNSVGASDLLQA
jgi:hypothetical protein